jgi:hypothetical protein
MVQRDRSLRDQQLQHRNQETKTKMHTLPIVNFNDLVDTIYATARLADLKALVKRNPGNKEVREAYENADAALFDPLFKAPSGDWLRPF